ncbi:MAG: glycoside hydrolase family 97 catalytic domain-containing protein [Bacteroidales bacterium]|nr:glycoside hydrolase family 97 catalytic domain-containing protein [Bacteroidales bacterium]
MKRTAIATVLLFAILMTFGAEAAAKAGKVYKIESPSGEIKVEVNVSESINWSLERSGVKILDPSAISMTLEDGTVFGSNTKVRRALRSSVDRIVTPVVYRQSEVRDHYNSLTLQCNGFNLVFRVYDDGAAYRFTASQKAGFKVLSEQAEFRLNEPGTGFVPYCRKKAGNIECQYFSSFETPYSQIELKDWEKDRLAFLPITINAAGGMKVCITESDLLNYPGMYLWNQDGDNSLEAVFAPYPKTIRQGGHNMLQGLVDSREEYIAKAGATEDFPWRIVIVSKEDKDLMTCDLPWLLGREPAAGEDFSWVRPGKVAWDWWNNWNLYGVDFPAGVNNDTYKYYIKFTGKNNIEYVILDEGWAVNKAANLFQVIPEIDLPMLCKYAEKKGVGLILWAGYWAFEKDMEKVCREYSRMGVKGFKVDFMDRDDQVMVDFYRRAAETAARYHLMIDFHGAFKPAGLQRTWPNVVNFEGVYGLENVKGQKKYPIDLVSYEVSIPFVRMVAGPADYTQGAMRNASKENFRYVSSEAMSQGTRCRQLAEYVIFDSPLTMLCDSPSNYMGEPECLQFISEVPTTWDQTIALDGKAGEYAAIARRKGDTWYVGAITDWNERELTLDLSFIGKACDMDIYRDGVNASKAARDYKKDWQLFPSDGKIDIKMASGGGWAAVIRSSPIPGEKADNDWAQFSRYALKNSELTRRPRAVLFGDSITQSWVRDDGEWLEEHNFAGRGISGQTTMQMLVRFRADVLDLKPEYVVILAGINDIGRNNGYISVEHTFDNIVSMVELARLHGIKPVMCTLLPAWEIGWRRRVGDPRPQIDKLNSLIRAYADEQGIPLVDYHSAMKTPDGAMKPELELDAVHPNLEGYKVMEKVLLGVIGD